MSNEIPVHFFHELGGKPAKAPHLVTLYGGRRGWIDLARVDNCDDVTIRLDDNTVLELDLACYDETVQAWQQWRRNSERDECERQGARLAAQKALEPVCEGRR